MLLFEQLNCVYKAVDSVLLIKIISALSYPLGLVAILFVLRLLAGALGARRVASLCAVAAIAILLLGSNPKFARWLAAHLESQYPQQQIYDIAKHDAIIVLGGGLRIPLAPAQHTQIGSGSDRYWYAARLYRAGKAPTILLTGGNVFAQPGMQGEAFYASELLQQWGVPKGAILIESGSRTTAQNRANTASFITRNNIKSALLVTSALHMPRAYESFRELPIPVTPASADVLIRQSQSPEILSWLPSAAALHLTTVAIHEIYGMWFNELKALMSNS